MIEQRASHAGRAWLVVALCFLALAFAFSARATLGLAMPLWVREFGWTKSFISGAGAAGLVVMACVAPFAGRFVDRFGPGPVLIAGMLATGSGAFALASVNSKATFVAAFSVLSAVGFGIVATHVVSTAVARLFETNRGLAIGIATSGATAGQFVIVPLVAYVLANTSWRWSYLGLAGGCATLVPLLWLLLRNSDVDQAAPSEGQEIRSLRADLNFLVRKPAFHGLFWSFLLCGYTTTGIIETHLIPYSAFCGFPPLPSATAYGVLSAVNLAGMICAGWLTDRVHRPTLLAGIYVIRGLSFLILMNVGASYETLLLFAVAFGVVDYSTIPVTASLAATHLGIERMGLAMGLISAGHAAGGALGAFFGGYLFDVTANYALVWWSGVWLAIIAALLVAPISGVRADSRWA